MQPAGADRAATWSGAAELPNRVARICLPPRKPACSACGDFVAQDWKLACWLTSHTMNSFCCKGNSQEQSCKALSQWSSTGRPPTGSSDGAELPDAPARTPQDVKLALGFSYQGSCGHPKLNNGSGAHTRHLPAVAALGVYADPVGHMMRQVTCGRQQVFSIACELAWLKKETWFAPAYQPASC